MTLSLIARGATRPRRGAAANQDAFLVATADRLFGVADGAGGHAAGEFAAQLALRALARCFCAGHLDRGIASPFAPAPRLPADLLRVAMKEANREVRAAAAANPALRGTAATLAALTVVGHQLVVAHAGDVRVYRIRKRVFDRLTRDRSLAVGSDDDLEPIVYVDSVTRGDLYLLCSDGLWSQLDAHRLAALATSASDLDQACQALIAAANDAGGDDDMTAVLVRVG